MSMYEVIGRNEPDYLLADPAGADVIAIPCKPGNGEVKRGTVMYRDDNGMYAPATAADVVNTKFLVVLDETVNTSSNETIAEDARAYRAGRLFRSKVTLAADAALTDAAVLVLRQQGIFFDQMDNAAAFNNKVGG